MWNQKLEVAETIFKMKNKGFAGGSVIKKTPADAGYTVSIHGPGRSLIPQSNQAPCIKTIEPVF